MYKFNINRSMACSVIACTSTLFTAPLMATDDITLGVKLGYQFAIGEDSPLTEPGSAVYGVYIGYDFNSTWGIDFGYQHWSDIHPINDVINQITVFESALRYTIPLNNELSAYARVGAGNWSIKEYGLSSSQPDGFSLMGEVGVVYKLSDSVQGSLGYQYMSNMDSGMSPFDSMGLVLSLSYRFKGGEGSAAPQERISRTLETPIETPIPILAINSVVNNASDIAVDIMTCEKLIGVDKSDALTLHKEKLNEIEDYLFASNSSYLHSTIELQVVLNYLKENPRLTVSLFGHTDDSGAKEYNHWLSERRAESVAQYFISHGINAARITTTSQGDSKPIADNRTVTGRSTNRRVELSFGCTQAS